MDMDNIAKMVANRIVAIVDANPDGFVEELDEGELLETAIQYVCEGTDITEEIDELYDKLDGNREIEAAFAKAREIIEFWESNTNEYEPGFRQRDFI